MTDVQLLDKTEIWLRGVTVADANLPQLANVVAGVLGLENDRVFVTDIGANHVCLDILVPNLALEQFAGKKDELMAALAQVPGVTIAADASLHSDGILGLIGAAADVVPHILDEARRMNEGLRNYAMQRVAVVSTGPELLDGRVHDTNFEAIHELLGGAGFDVERGGVVDDDLERIAGRVARLVDESYGIVVTTGGVGAEAKDKTVEALLHLDPSAATAIIASFKQGHGRHVKSAIRIAVAQIGYALVVALPGPTHEVRLALPILIEGLRNQWSAASLVEALATPLRDNFARHSAAAHAHHA